ncbi:MAG: hypothetical protein WBC44_01915 [Planctomycetaceae bacterium]
MTNPTAGFQKAIRNGLKLGAAVVAGWLVLAGPAWWFDGLSGLEGLSIAAALCLIPGWLVFALHSQYGTAAPLAVLLTGTIGRMATVLIGALAVKAWRPDYDMTLFALFLGAFYVLTLAIETKLQSKPPCRGTPSDD